MVSAVLRRLSDGYEPQPMFDRRALPIYAMLGATMLLAVAVLAVRGYTVSPDYLAPAWSFPLLLLAAFACRRVGLRRLAGMLEANTLLTGEAVFIYLLLIPLAAWSAPYFDPVLSRADVAMAFNWKGFADWALPYMPLLLRAYRSFQWEPSVVIIILFWWGPDSRAWQLVLAATVALIVIALLFPFVPAKGPFVYYGVHSYSGFASRGPWLFADTLEHIRSGTRLIDGRMFAGIVSFPSFHTVMATLLVWAAWPTKARIPVLLLNVLMVLAAIVCGSHYLIDLIGGFVLAVISLVAAKSISANGRIAC